MAFEGILARSDMDSCLTNEGELGVTGGVVVLGMHRSGTSVVTQLFQTIGFSPGRDRRLQRGGPSNPRGFWEVQSLTRINEQVLRHQDGEWSAPPELAQGWERDSGLQKIGASARKEFAKRMPLGEAWVWKDPRL